MQANEEVVGAYVPGVHSTHNLSLSANPTGQVLHVEPSLQDVHCARQAK